MKILRLQSSRKIDNQKESQIEQLVMNVIKFKIMLLDYLKEDI